MAWLVLRYGRSDELAHRLPLWTALFAQVQASPEGAEHLVVVIRYLLWTGDEATRAAAEQVLHSVIGAQQTEALMGSWAEEMIERGLQRGLEKGLAQGLEQGLAQGLEKGLTRGREEGLLRGRAESLLRILARRGIHADEATRQRILDCTEAETLDRWFDRALQATTLSDVLNGEAHESEQKDS